ncbi:MAG: HAMP domain-containing histidine kinase [Chloroflexi bacterium]|nr:HAMP domain-containing histidine kinase [Chloroflexota bacterium]
MPAASPSRSATRSSHAQTVQQLEALRDLHERVSDLEQVKTIMLQLGAHDLGDPLMLINNFVAYLRDDLMQGKPAGEAQFEYLHQIEAAAERIHRISRDITRRRTSRPADRPRNASRCCR